MTFRKRLFQLFIILNVVIALLMSYSFFSYLKSQSEQVSVSPMRNTGEKFTFKFHLENNTTKNQKCIFIPANFTIYDFDKSVYSKFHCVPVHILNGFSPICVHKLRDNVEQSIREIEQEQSALEDFERILRNNAEYDVINIGVHLGLYSLLAAKLRRLVFAVEPMEFNVKVFHQTVIINRIETLVTLVGGRPLSDDYKTIHMTAFNNGMASWIKYSIYSNRPRKNHVIATETAKTILMDDLLNAVPFYKAIMAINIDGNEATVIKRGQRFIDCLDIAYIFMKWTNMMLNDQKFIIDFFSYRNYVAHASTSDFRELPIDSFYKWPPNIVWKKDKK